VSEWVVVAETAVTLATAALGRDTTGARWAAATVPATARPGLGGSTYSDTFSK